jgi:hypothetical protein
LKKPQEGYDFSDCFTTIVNKFVGLHAWQCFAAAAAAENVKQTVHHLTFTVNMPSFRPPAIK